MSGQRVRVALAVLLALGTAAVYAAVWHADFFYLDDPYYVTENPHVRDGLTLAGLGHAFFASYGALWMPLAFTAHMLDVSVFGLAPRGPHVVNVVLHVANALLLLTLLVRTTGAFAPSLVAGALFALHPLRVESVAWVAERKDVLSACMGLCAFHAWVSWVRAPGPRTWRWVVVATVLALLSKPMLVTLPVLLCCFDVWPLRRLGAPGPDGRPLGVRDLVREKRVLFALAGAAAAITMIAARRQGAVVGLGDRPLGTRVVHALVSLVWYAGKSGWPTGLGIFYPYPHWSTLEIAGALAVVVAAVAVASATWRRAPWIAAGLAWFAVGLLPVSGLVQAGGQGMADRFTYLPAIGLTTAVVWTIHETVHSRAARAAFAGGALVAVAALAVVAQRQVAYWTTSEALFTRTLAVTSDNWRVESALGNVLANAGRYAEAYPHFVRALALVPDDPGAHYGVGLALDGLGRAEEAVAQYRETLRLDPGHWRAHNNLGVFLVRHGDVEGALHHFDEAVRLNPNAADARDNLRGALAMTGFPKDQVDGYVSGLVAWGMAIASDREEPGGAPYGTRLAADWLQEHAATIAGCMAPGEGGRPAAAFSLYLQIDASGGLSALAAMPPTAAARCVREELRTARAPAPPFAPFHATVAVPSAG